jgi:hypothetical protein
MMSGKRDRNVFRDVWEYSALSLPRQFDTAKLFVGAKPNLANERVRLRGGRAVCGQGGQGGKCTVPTGLGQSKAYMPHSAE